MSKISLVETKRRTRRKVNDAGVAIRGRRVRHVEELDTFAIKEMAQLHVVSNVGFLWAGRYQASWLPLSGAQHGFLSGENRRIVVGESAIQIRLRGHCRR